MNQEETDYPYPVCQICAKLNSCIFYRGLTKCFAFNLQGNLEELSVRWNTPLWYKTDQFLEEYIEKHEKEWKSMPFDKQKKIKNKTIGYIRGLQKRDRLTFLKEEKEVWYRIFKRKYSDKHKEGKRDAFEFETQP